MIKNFDSIEEGFPVVTESQETSAQKFERMAGEATVSYFQPQFYLPVEDFNDRIYEFIAHKSYNVTITSGAVDNNDILFYQVSPNNANSDKGYYQILKTAASQSAERFAAYPTTGSNKVDIASGGLLISIPSNRLGEGIEIGSVSVTYDVTGFTLVTTDSLRDDGQGNLIGENSSPPLVGSVFYGYGMIFIPDRNPDSLWSKFGDDAGDYITLEYRSKVPIREHNWYCHIPQGAFNFSYNPTSHDNPASDTGSTAIKRKNIPFQPYISSVGLYNDRNELLVIAKLAKPIKKTVDMDLSFHIRIDF